jgi:itaconate CoA-transferase
MWTSGVARSIELSRQPEENITAAQAALVNLKGRSSSERARALIGLAHPQFRDELAKAAKELHLI